MFREVSCIRQSGDVLTEVRSSQPMQKSRDHRGFLRSECWRNFIQLPRQRIQRVATVLQQNMRSTGEMFQIMTSGIFYAQAADAVKHIAYGIDAMSGVFEKGRGLCFGVDVERRGRAEVALQGTEFGHGKILLS